MKRVLLFTLLLCLVAVRLAGQTSTDKCTRSTEGKEFWLGFMESRHHQAGHYLELTFTSSMTCHFSLYIGKSTVAYYSGTLQPNTPVLYQPAWSMVEPIGSETIESKAIHVVSDNPMNIFAMNWSPNSADAAVIFPVDALGSEYYAVCYEPNINEGAGGAPGNGKNSEFVIVASEDNTKVTITPSKVTDLLKPANVPFVITLNKGELYQVQSMNHANLAGQGDLTGSYISSDKPIAFYSGCWSTTIPIGANSAWDHLYEQIPPIRSWGRKFVTVPLKGRTI
ncbi:MAG: IgGFc-binding protein, partial [Marinilabiliales bacterium]|nr:IgGFc-binding protein [Marinilabiliales bacterium]